MIYCQFANLPNNFKNDLITGSVNTLNKIIFWNKTFCLQFPTYLKRFIKIYMAGFSGQNAIGLVSFDYEPNIDQ